jgi:hypothetical protein
MYFIFYGFLKLKNQQVQLTFVLLLSEASREHATMKHKKKMGTAVAHQQQKGGG